MLRIAQVAPLYESVPPLLYGGTERVVSYLTEELVRQGHEVTLFASGDSVTRARLVPACERALRLDRRVVDALAHHVAMVEKVYRQADLFDLIHFHIDYVHFPVSRREGVPQLTTLHGRLDLRDLVPLYREFAEMPVVSISEAQRAPLPWLNWLGTVYHGLPVDAYPFRERARGYLAFLGRVSPEKGIESAVEIARRSGRRLRIAAKIDRADRDYFEERVRPLLRREPGVEFLGEVGGAAKGDLLGGAEALLFPVDWPEPFGMVMIEALACGTPIVALSRGSVPEVMADPRTGFVCATVEEAAAAVGRIGGLARRACRQVFEERFTAPRMARDYLEIYRRLLAEAENQARAGTRAPDRSRAGTRVPEPRCAGTGVPDQLQSLARAGARVLA